MTIHRRDVLRYLGLAAAAAPLSRWAPPLFARDRRPNIVVILADDHRHDALGCAGHPFMRTPALDRLADTGVRFTNAFVTTSLCSPSRASFLTGRYAHSHGIVHNQNRDIPRAVPTYPALLQKAGYDTAFVGKWHLGASRKPRHGFDHWVSFERQGTYRGSMLDVDGRDVPCDGYITDVLTDHALKFIDRPREAPFLLVLSHKGAHDPFEPAARHAHLYADQDPDLYFRPDPAAPDRRVFPEGYDYRDNRGKVLDYYRSLASVDDSVGAVCDALDAADLADDTIVVYSSDNGFMLGEHGGMWDKRRAYEPSIRVPMIARWPGRTRPGTVNGEMVLNIDLMPSLLEAAGADCPAEVQGRSWWPLLRGAPGREAWLYEFFRKGRAHGATAAVRTRRWKSIVPLDNRGDRNHALPLELYDLENDPDEETNLAADPAHAPKLAEMLETYERLIGEYGRVRRPRARR